MLGTFLPAWTPLGGWCCSGGLLDGTSPPAWTPFGGWCCSGGLLSESLACELVLVLECVMDDGLIHCIATMGALSLCCLLANLLKAICVYWHLTMNTVRGQPKMRADGRLYVCRLQDTLSRSTSWL